MKNLILTILLTLSFQIHANDYEDFGVYLTLEYSRKPLSNKWVDFFMTRLYCDYEITREQCLHGFDRKDIFRYYELFKPRLGPNYEVWSRVIPVKGSYKNLLKCNRQVEY